ncbi:MAG: 2-C-methyl-D-erythritol 4-phosphate cytidylyltransferase [Planctomycetota bacterium]
MAAAFATAIVVAAGRSTRMGSPSTPKPLLPLGGEAILRYSLRALAAAQSVADVIVVARTEHFAPIEAMLLECCGRQNTTVLEGGEERFHSVQRGCEAVPADREVVLIHDAARPFVRSEQIDAVALAAREHGAGLLAMPVTDSLHRSMDGRKVFEPVDRSSLWAAQTPQAFRIGPFLQALREAQRLGTVPTDDVALWERFVGAVQLVPGSPENFKITHPSDLWVAESLLQQRTSHESP